jgi:hypothetical protein
LHLFGGDPDGAFARAEPEIAFRRRCNAGDCRERHAAALQDGVKALTVEMRQAKLAAGPDVFRARLDREDVAEIEPVFR